MGSPPAAFPVYRKDVYGVSVLLVTVSPGRPAWHWSEVTFSKCLKVSTYAVTHRPAWTGSQPPPAVTWGHALIGESIYNLPGLALVRISVPLSLVVFVELQIRLTCFLILFLSWSPENIQTVHSWPKIWSLKVFVSFCCTLPQILHSFWPPLRNRDLQPTEKWNWPKYFFAWKLMARAWL